MLKLAGSTAALLGSVAVGSVGARSWVNLGRKGLREGDRVDPYLDSYFREGASVHVPEGTYRWDGTALDATADAELVGHGTVEFDVPEVGLMENVVAKEGTVAIRNITQTGAVDSTKHSRIAAWAAEGAELVFESFDRPDGQVGDGSGGPIGFFTPPKHAGRMVYRNCHVEGFGNNGIYASGPKKGGNGPVIVEGGLYRNNNIGSIRVGSDGSVVRDVTVVNDAGLTDVIGPGGGRNARLLWVRRGGEDLAIENVHATITAEASGTSLGVGIVPGNGRGSGTLDGCYVRNGSNAPPLKVKGSVADDWTTSDVHLTGDGNRSPMGGGDWVDCSGDDCPTPTQTAQVVEDDAE